MFYFEIIIQRATAVLPTICKIIEIMDNRENMVNNELRTDVDEIIKSVESAHELVDCLMTDDRLVVLFEGEHIGTISGPFTTS